MHLRMEYRVFCNRHMWLVSSIRDAKQLLLCNNCGCEHFCRNGLESPVSTAKYSSPSMASQSQRSANSVRIKCTDYTVIEYVDSGVEYVKPVSLCFCTNGKVGSRVLAMKRDRTQVADVLFKRKRKTSQRLRRMQERERWGEIENQKIDRVSGDFAVQSAETRRPKLIGLCVSQFVPKVMNGVYGFDGLPNHA